MISLFFPKIISSLYSLITSPLTNNDININSLYSSWITSPIGVLFLKYFPKMGSLYSPLIISSIGEIFILYSVSNVTNKLLFSFKLLSFKLFSFFNIDLHISLWSISLLSLIKSYWLLFIFIFTVLCPLFIIL